MKRDFLKNLGIEDKNIIDQILDENSKDIGKAKGDADDLENQISQLRIDLNKKTTELDTLKESTKDYDSLTQKVTQLENEKSQLTIDKNNLETELNNKVSQMRKDYAVENRIREYKGKNIKAIKALLDMDKITHENDELAGINEQLDALVGAEDSSMLFGATQTAPTGTHFSTPPVNGAVVPPTSNSFAEAIAKALTTN